MVFVIDPNTQCLITRVPQDGVVEEFDCDAKACGNPACRCMTVTSDMRAGASSASEQPMPAPDHTLGVDLGIRAIDTAFRNTASPSGIAFAEALLAAMEPADFELLGHLHYEIKSRAEEEAKADEIDAHFTGVPAPDGRCGLAKAGAIVLVGTCRRWHFLSAA